MNILNEYFDKIYCINLDRRPDRWEKCSKQFERLGIVVERFSAIDKLIINNPTKMRDGQYAFSLSHLHILKMAQAQKLKNVLIFEDDVVMCDNISEIFKKNIENIPNDWVMLYLGGNHLNGTLHVTGDVHRMNATLTTHAYAMNSSIFDSVVRNVEKWFTTWPQPLDVYYAFIHRSDPCYVIQDGPKQLTWQDVGYSDIDESECDYTWLK